MGSAGSLPSCPATCIGTDFRALTLTSLFDGVTIKPPLALGGWVAFKPMARSTSGEAMAMGDLVLSGKRD